MKTKSNSQKKNTPNVGGKFYWQRLFGCFSTRNFSMSSILETHLTLSYDVTQASAHIFIATL